MFSVLYVVWFLLPLTFFMLWIWSFLKPWFKVHGREDKKHHFSQTLFCLVGFFISVAIDRTELFRDTIDNLSLSWFDLNTARWVLYPSVLLVLAWLQQIFTHRKKQPSPTPGYAKYR